MISFTKTEAPPTLDPRQTAFATALPLRSAFGRFITLTQIIADALTVYACYMGSYLYYTEIYGGWSPQTLPQFAALSCVIALLYVFILDRVGLYRREISLLNIKELRGIFHVGLYAAAIILSATFYVRFMTLSRLTFTIAIIAAPVALLLQRRVFYKIHVLFHLKGWSQTKVLIFGAGRIGVHLAKRLFQSPSLGMLPVGFLDDDVSRHRHVLKSNEMGPRHGLPVLGGEEILAQCRKLGVDQVIIALPSAKFDRNQRLVELCVANKIKYAIVPNSYDQFIQQIEMFEIGGIPILRRRQNSASYVYLALKRALDFFVSLGLIIALSPLYLVIGLAIKLESKGTIIFKQKRVGLRGREFSFYKFRSMFIDAEKYARTPSDPSDPRITKVGRWLRRTSFDELPQLFNVLRGDMSLVGPRPEMPFIVSQYTTLERQRLEAKPGITGVWQISCARGEPIHVNMEYDLFYLQNRSMLLDLAILAKTAWSVVRGVGAI